MVFNTTLNNISVISWGSVLLVEETRVPWKNHQPVTSHWQTWSHKVVSRHLAMSGIQTHTVSGSAGPKMAIQILDKHSKLSVGRVSWNRDVLFLALHK